jgi:hypothetical protein
MSLSSTNAGPAPMDGRISGGSGLNSAHRPGRSWQMRKETVRRRPVPASGAGFHEATAQKLPARSELQRLLEILRSDSFSLCSRKTLLTDRSENLAGSWSTHKRFFGRLRQKLAQQVRRTRAASESERTGHLTTKLFVEWYNEAVT